MRMIKLSGLAEDLLFQIKVWAVMIRYLIYWSVSKKSSELSSEPEENLRNLTSLTEIFQIIPE